MAGKAYRWRANRKEEVINALRSSPTRIEAARKLKTTTHALGHACKVYGIDPMLLVQHGASPVILAPPSPERSADEILKDRIERFARREKHEDARNLIPVHVPDSRPIGILHFGDPHLDDDGTNLGLLEQHVRIVQKTDGLYAANVGDTTNNWVGRLAILYGQQSTTEAEAWTLAQWFVGELADKWLYLVSGNHDAWSGGSDPLKWIAGQVGALYQSSEARIALRFKNRAEIRVNCRHDFDGHSQWNPAHGPMKALTMGNRDDLAVAGHKHISAYGVLRDPDTGKTMHALRVASYKRYDRYVLDKGLRDQHISPCALTVMDPTLDPKHPGRVKVFWDAAEGAEFLTWTRKRKRAAA